MTYVLCYNVTGYFKQIVHKIDGIRGNKMAIKELESLKVSIIMPAYNVSRHIEKTVNSVIRQTHTNWELLIVDDCSTDNTVAMIQSFHETDSRINVYELEKNSGAAVARNKAIEQATGDYLAFLDSDDLWEPEKLEKQLTFMIENNYLFTSTNYIEVNEATGETIGVVKSYPELDYEGLLKHCPGNSTVMYNVSELGKFYIPDIKKRNDFVMWLQVIKKAKKLYGLDENLTTYTIREGSLSKDKKDLVKYQWTVYRDIEGLSFMKSLYLLLHKTISVLLK